MKSIVLILSLTLVVIAVVFGKGGKRNVKKNKVNKADSDEKPPIVVQDVKNLTINSELPSFRSSARRYSRREYYEIVEKYERYCDRHSYETSYCSWSTKKTRHTATAFEKNSYCTMGVKPLHKIMFNNVPYVLVNSKSIQQYIEIPTCRTSDSFCCGDNTGVTGNCGMDSYTVPKVLFASPMGQLCELDLIVPICKCNKISHGYCPVPGKFDGCTNCFEENDIIEPCSNLYC